MNIRDLVLYYGGAFLGTLLVVVVQAISGEMIKWYQPFLWAAVWVAWEVGARFLKRYLELRRREKQQSKGYRVADRDTLV